MFLSDILGGVILKGANLMKVKCISQKEDEHYKFFLRMIVPFTIGMMIFSTSLAYGVWSEEDPNLSVSPYKQGWIEVVVEEPQR